MNSKTDLISGLRNAKLSIKIFMNNKNNFHVSAFCYEQSINPNVPSG